MHPGAGAQIHIFTVKRFLNRQESAKLQEHHLLQRDRTSGSEKAFRTATRRNPILHSVHVPRGTFNCAADIGKGDPLVRDHDPVVALDHVDRAARPASLLFEQRQIAQPGEMAHHYERDECQHLESDATATGRGAGSKVAGSAVGSSTMTAAWSPRSPPTREPGGLPVCAAHARDHAVRRARSA